MLYTCSNISRLVPFDWATPDYMHYVIYMFKYLAVSTIRLDHHWLYALCYIHVQISLGQYLSTGPPLTICIMLYTCSNISRLVPFGWTTPDYMHYVIYMFKYLQVSTFRMDHPWLYALCDIHFQISLGQYPSTLTTPDYMHYVIYMFKHL